jgi:hypothetical protein
METGFTKRARAGGIAKAEKHRLLSEQKVKQDYDFDLLNQREKRERILLEQKYMCSECSVSQEWNNKPLKFELDHINGDRKNNKRHNLRLICPNCHSQTDTYKVGNNKNPGKVSYTDDDIVASLMRNTSGYAAMKDLGMNPHGGNYTRLRRIVKEKSLNLQYNI